jgi:rhomboid protease GluP
MGSRCSYAVAGVSGGLASALWHPHVVSVGASGAICGIWGALLAFVWLEGTLLPKAIARDLWSNVAIAAACTLTYGIFVPSVDNAAHMGGLVSGFYVGSVLAQPLTAVTPTTRRSRATLAFVYAGITLLFFSIILADEQQGAGSAIATLAQNEKRLVAQFNETVERWNARKLADDDFAEFIEQSLLPEWTAAIAPLQTLDARIAASWPVVPLYLEYFGRQEGAWSELARAVRRNDRSEFETAQKKQHEANAHAEKIRSFYESS